MFFFLADFIPFFFSSSSLQTINIQTKPLSPNSIIIITQSIQSLYLIVDYSDKKDNWNTVVQYYPSPSKSSHSIIFPIPTYVQNIIIPSCVCTFCCLIALNSILFNMFLLTRSQTYIMLIDGKNIAVQYCHHHHHQRKF